MPLGGSRICLKAKEKKLNSVVLSPLANYTDRAIAAKLVPTLADRGCHVVSATSPSDRNFNFLDLEPLLILPSKGKVVPVLN
jgi:hypothetical protein